MSGPVPAYHDSGQVLPPKPPRLDSAKSNGHLMHDELSKTSSVGHDFSAQLGNSSSSLYHSKAAKLLKNIDDPHVRARLDAAMAKGALQNPQLKSTLYRINNKRNSGGRSPMYGSGRFDAGAIERAEQAALDCEIDPGSPHNVISQIEHVLMSTDDDPLSIARGLVSNAVSGLKNTTTEIIDLRIKLQDAKDDANAGTRALLPSAWVKREQKYKSDLENYEMTIIAQQEQVAALERELQSLRDGEQAKALEERLKELQKELRVALQEKTQTLAQYHELSVKYRKLLEAAPAAGSARQDAMHTASGQPQQLQQQQSQHVDASAQRRTTEDRPNQGVRAGQQMFNGQDDPSRFQPGAGGRASRNSSSGGTGSLVSEAIAASEAAQRVPGDVSSQQQRQQWRARRSQQDGDASQTQLLQQSQSQQKVVAATAEASWDEEMLAQELAEVKAINADITTQLLLYQQMVDRMRSTMEKFDIEKAALEADKADLTDRLSEAERMLRSARIGGAAGSTSGARGWGSSVGGWFSSRLSRAPASVAGDSEMLPQPGQEDLDDLIAAAAGPEQLGSPYTPALSAPVNGLPDGALDPAAAAAAADAARVRQLANALKDARSQVGDLQGSTQKAQQENAFLMESLVNTKVELAETQGQTLQFKRALIRAMDREACMDLRIRELEAILDMLTSAAAGSSVRSEDGANSSFSPRGAANGGPTYNKLAIDKYFASRANTEGESSTQPGTPLTPSTVNALQRMREERAAEASSVSPDGLGSNSNQALMRLSQTDVVDSSRSSIMRQLSEAQQGAGPNIDSVMEQYRRSRSSQDYGGSSIARRTSASGRSTRASIADEAYELASMERADPGSPLAPRAASAPGVGRRHLGPDRSNSGDTTVGTAPEADALHLVSESSHSSGEEEQHGQGEAAKGSRQGRS